MFKKRIVKITKNTGFSGAQPHFNIEVEGRLLFSPQKIILNASEVQGGFFLTPPPPLKVPSAKKLRQG